MAYGQMSFLGRFDATNLNARSRHFGCLEIRFGDATGRMSKPEFGAFCYLPRKLTLSTDYVPIFLLPRYHGISRSFRLSVHSSSPSLLLFKSSNDSESIRLEALPAKCLNSSSPRARSLPVIVRRPSDGKTTVVSQLNSVLEMYN